MNLTIHTAFADNAYELDYVLNNFKSYYAKRLEDNSYDDTDSIVKNSVNDVCEDLGISCYHMGNSDWVFTNKGVSYETLAKYWE